MDGGRDGGTERGCAPPRERKDRKLGYSQTDPTPVFADNEASESSVGSSERARCIGLRDYFVHEARSASSCASQARQQGQLCRHPQQGLHAPRRLLGSPSPHHGPVGHRHTRNACVCLRRWGVCSLQSGSHPSVGGVLKMSDVEAASAEAEPKTRRRGLKLRATAHDRAGDGA